LGLRKASPEDVLTNGGAAVDVLASVRVEGKVLALGEYIEQDSPVEDFFDEVMRDVGRSAESAERIEQLGKSCGLGERGVVADEHELRPPTLRYRKS